MYFTVLVIINFSSKMMSKLRRKMSTPPNLPFDRNDLNNVISQIRDTVTASGSGSGEGENSRWKNIIAERYKKYLEDLCKNSPQILLIGDTGLGKSSCINIIFNLKLNTEDDGNDAAAVSHGVPCTQNFQIFGPTEHCPVRIIDSKGIEKQTVAQQTEEMLGYIKEKARSADPLEHVHLVYYFANISRWQEHDTEMVKKLQENCGVIIVINKCDIRKAHEIRELREEIGRRLGSIHIAECGDPRGSYNWIPDTCRYNHHRRFLDIDYDANTWVCNFTISVAEDGEPMRCGQFGDDSPFGHKDLVRMSIEELPLLVRPSFQSAQRVDLRQKHLLAAGVIGTSSATAAGVGAIPIPFADLPILLGIEAMMAGSLMVVYEVPFETFNGMQLAALNVGIIGGGGAFGYLAAQVFKAVPVMGNAAGASIDMVVAGTVVMTLGIAIAKVLARTVEEGTINTGENLFNEVAKAVGSIEVSRIVMKMMDRSGTDSETANNEIASLIESGLE